MSWTLRATGIGDALIVPIDPREVYAGMAALADPAGRIQLQAIGNGYPVAHLDGNDLDAIADRCDQWNKDGPKSIFWKINPVVPGCTGVASDSDIVRRYWLFIDVDTLRPTHEEEPATDAEKAQSRLVLEAIKEFLAGEGWATPNVLDSGNGWHLYYRVDLPNSDVAKQAIKRFLKALSTKFTNNAAKIDPSVYNSSRYGRVPGTWSRRGKQSAERPWRKCSILEIRAQHVVSLAQIHSATEKLERPKEVAPPVSTGFTLRATNDETVAYVKAAIDDECKKVASCPAGNRNNTLNTAAFNLGQLVHLKAVFEQEILAQLTLAASTCGLESGEANQTIKSGMAAGKLTPRSLPERNGPTRAALPPPGQSILMKASEVTTRDVEWLWPARIPLGKLTTFAGVGGLGKTFVLLDIAARISRGAAWPDEGTPAGAGKVIFASGEDDAEDTLVPRLIELGADLSKIYFFKPQILGSFTLADLETLNRAITDAGPGVRLVCIDPPTAYLGEVNDHKNAELRGLLSPLKDWASQHRVAMVFITHVSKAQGAVSAMDRVIGSVAWVNAVRAAHLFARDPDDPDKQIFVPMKMNLARRRNGLGYRLVESGKVAKVEWLGEVDTTADDAAQFRAAPRTQRASEWLIEMFRRKLEWDSDDLFSAGRQAGISKHGIYEARKALNLPKARYQVKENGDRVFTWWVPPNWEHLQNSSGNRESGVPVDAACF